MPENYIQFGEIAHSAGLVSFQIVHQESNSFSAFTAANNIRIESVYFPTWNSDTDTLYVRGTRTPQNNDSVIVDETTYERILAAVTEFNTYMCGTESVESPVINNVEKLVLEVVSRDATSVQFRIKEQAKRCMPSWQARNWITLLTSSYPDVSGDTLYLRGDNTSRDRRTMAVSKRQWRRIVEAVEEFGGRVEGDVPSRSTLYYTWPDGLWFIQQGKKVEPCWCEKCGKVSGAVGLCEDCFEEAYPSCTCCGRPTEVRSITLNTGTVQVCQDCADSMKVCANCEKYYLSGRELDGKCYCTVCVARYGSKNCPICLKSIFGKQTLCTECLEDWVVCVHCGNAVPKEQYHRFMADGSETHYCLRCAQNYIRACTMCGCITRQPSCICKVCGVEVIREYGWEPAWKLHGNGELHMGIELETFRQMDEEKRYEIAGELKKNFSMFHAANDGSIGTGLEMISHPATFWWWRDNCGMVVEFMNALRAHGLTDGTGSCSCGLHINLSKRFFTAGTLYKFLQFVYHNSTFIERVF